MRFIVLWSFGLVAAGAQALQNPPSTQAGEITLVTAFVIAISALAYAIKTQYHENRQKDAKLEAYNEKYATLLERVSSLMERIEDKK